MFTFGKSISLYLIRQTILIILVVMTLVGISVSVWWMFLYMYIQYISPPPPQPVSCLLITWLSRNLSPNSSIHYSLPPMRILTMLNYQCLDYADQFAVIFAAIRHCSLPYWSLLWGFDPMHMALKLLLLMSGLWFD